MEEDPNIIRLNIGHYEEMLKRDLDDAKRKVINGLMANAEYSLRA